MRIAIFTDTYLPIRDGVVTSIDRFTKLMADDGHQILIFCPKCGRYKDKPYPNITIKRYLSVTPPTYKDYKVALPFVLNVTSDLKEFKPDIVHIQTPLGIGWIGIWATKILKIKNIQTYHTYIPDFLVYLKPTTLFGINKIASYINSSKLLKALIEADISKEKYGSAKFQSYIGQRIKEITEKASKNSNGRFTERFGRDYTRVVYNRADLVLTPSKAMRDTLIRQGVKTKVEVLSNGIDYDLFKKKSDYSIQNRIIHMGRLGHEKNIEVVIQAFSIAHKKIPNLRLDILGDGPSKKSLQSLVKNLNLSKEIKFGGAYDINKISQDLCEYDFFVTASTIETQGLVVLETMASGLPVLGVKKLAIPEIVLDGKNGYISKPFDAEGMAKNILKILEDEDRLREFGKKSLAIAKAHEINKCKDQLIRFYRKVAKK
ncbi:MAG: glycosyltransferase [Patescibacteria group bacterium]|nr:glycosyltransferase [Patescibacteria group bacterium]